MDVDHIEIEKIESREGVIRENVPPKNFLKSDENVIKLVKDLDLVLNKIEDLNYTNPGLELIYDAIYNLIYFVLEMKQLEYDKDYYNRRYMGMPPWEQEEARPLIKKLTEFGLNGKILDVGCGTGKNSIYIADQGFEITGIDFSEMAIQKARENAKKVGSTANFFVRDFFELPKDGKKYETIIDCGLYHTLTNKLKENYTDIIEELLNHGGKFYLFCTSENFGFGPAIVTKNEIEERFNKSFIINSIERIKLKGAIGVMKGWLASIDYP